MPRCGILQQILLFQWQWHDSSTRPINDIQIAGQRSGSDDLQLGPQWAWKQGMKPMNVGLKPHGFERRLHTCDRTMIAGRSGDVRLAAQHVMPVTQLLRIGAFRQFRSVPGVGRRRRPRRREAEPE